MTVAALKLTDDVVVYCMQGPHIKAVWNDIEPMLVKALDLSGNETTPEWIYDQLSKEQATAWICYDEANEARAVMITQPLTSVSGTWIDLMLTYSDGDLPIINHLLSTVEDWARSSGYAGIKMITLRDEVESVMTKRYGMKVRFKELVKKFG